MALPRPFMVPINLCTNELQNAVFQNLGTAPSTPKKGQFYFDTSTNKLMVWNGTAWIAGGSGASGDVFGPASSSNNSFAQFDGATGKLLKQGPVTDDGTTLTTSRSLSVDGLSAEEHAIFNGGCTMHSSKQFLTSWTHGVTGLKPFFHYSSIDQKWKFSNDGGISSRPFAVTFDDLNDGTTNVAFTATEKTKLTGIEANATADMTAAEILTAIKTVDGTGSLLDADKLDGQEGTYYAPETAATIGAIIGGATASLAPVDTDVFPFADSENALKKLTWAYVKSNLVTYFDTLYAAKTHATTHKSGGADAIKLNELAAPTAAVSLNSQKITSLATPTAGTDAATKDYVDAARAGLSIKDPVRLASTANVAIATGTLLTIDGVTTVAGNRVLLKNQTAPAENGIYIAATGAWTRATDFDATAEIGGGDAVWVNEGTTNGDSRWVLTTNDAITLGTTGLTFTKDFQASDVVAGAGLTKSGNQLDVVGTANRIVANADSVDIASTYVGQSSITTLGTITTGVWNGTDIAIANGGTGASDAGTARSNLGLAIGSNVQAFSSKLVDIAALAVTDGNIIVGNGTTWVAENGATARGSLGLGTIATQAANSVAITGGSISGITDLAVADGGTGASNAAGAKTNLGFMGRYATDNLVATAGTATTYTHNLNTLDVIVQVFNKSTGAQEEFDIVHNGVNTITLAASDALTAGTYRIVIMG